MSLLPDHQDPPTEDLADQWAESSAAPSSVKPFLKGLVLMATLLAVGGAVKHWGLADALDTAWLDREVVGKGISGELLFILLGAVLSAVGVPRQLVAFGGGYAFGLWLGSLISLVSQIFGCALSFFYARLLGRSLIRQKFSQRIQKVDRFLQGHPFTMTLLIRFLPVGSNLATNLAAGVTSVPARSFLLGSLLGFVPQTVIFALLGSGIHLDTVFRTALSVALFVVSGALGVALYRRVRRDNA